VYKILRNQKRREIEERRRKALALLIVRKTRKILPCEVFVGLISDV
jgi:hypothetical protein